MRIALEPEYFIEALHLPQSAARGFIREIPLGYHTLLVSAPLFYLYEAALLENKKALGLRYSDIQGLLSMLAEKGSPVKLHSLWRPVLKKPGRDILMATAFFGQADALLLTDKTAHFYKKAAKRFRLDLVTDPDLIEKGDIAA